MKLGPQRIAVFDWLGKSCSDSERQLKKRFPELSYEERGTEDCAEPAWMPPSFMRDDVRGLLTACQA